jgi:hypothetical protein
MTSLEPAEQITVRGVTPEFFDALGARPLYGRTLKPDDAERNADTPPAVLSYGFWRRRFHGDPSVVQEQTILVNKQRFSIVGVMPREFNGLPWTRGRICAFLRGLHSAYEHPRGTALLLNWQDG